MKDSICSNNNNWMEEEEENDHQQHDEPDEELQPVVTSRPIICGYCFGPKKIKSMNLVMAEASKTKLLHTVIDQQQEEEKTNEAAEEEEKEAFTSSALRLHDHRHDDIMSIDGATPVSLQQQQHSLQPCSTRTVIFTMDDDDEQERSGGRSLLDFHLKQHHVVRHGPLSCLSVDASEESTGTCTASTSTSTLNSMLSTRSSSMSRTTKTTTTTSSPTVPNNNSNNTWPIRISFVPLDPELPLEEQHGGKMDIILHKLTEDILCLSQQMMQDKTHVLGPEEEETTSMMDDPNEQQQQQAEQAASIRRVHRLTQYQLDHPECCLVDNPTCVQTLMNRAEIARVLDQCLEGVTSSSGMSVRSPPYTVLRMMNMPRVSITSSNSSGAGADYDPTTISQLQVEQAGLRFPVIVKPLVAAGTKASHSMAVLMDASALNHITAPCLCQEYANHDSLLYKVYVLGEYVSVHKRRSLPNLPRQGTTKAVHGDAAAAAETPNRCSYVEFDSQRPYPRLADFGVDPQHTTEQASSLKRRRSRTAVEVVVPKPNKLSAVVVNTEEVLPIVNALKLAFGLELFGFDVLIAASDDDNINESRQMFVVDVNYFPSYKEVPNFPALLAKYLTDRAIQSRKRSGRRSGQKSTTASTIPTSAMTL